MVLPRPYNKKNSNFVHFLKPQKACSLSRKWRSAISFSLLSILLASTVKAQSGVFDVRKYGAGQDVTTALKNAWSDACASANPSKVVIPKGTFFLHQVTLGGPCKAEIEIQVDGILKAPVDPKDVQGIAWVVFEYIENFKLSGSGTFDGQGKIAWGKNVCHKTMDCYQLPIGLRFDFINNGLVQGVTSLDSKNFHINVLGCKNLTFDHVTITAPGDSLNTDGIHIGRSKGVYIRDSKIGTGDDCVSIGDGGVEIHIERITCGPGHGISVGSLGKYPNEEPVNGVFVKSCTISGTTNGVRIKSWPNLYGGSVSNMHFEDIIMNDVSNPVIIDQVYCPWNQCNTQASSKVKISDVHFSNIRGTSQTLEAVKISCSSGFPCEKVELSNINLNYSGSNGSAKSVCSNVKPIISGTFNPSGC